jgi:hypothetical protein
MSPGSDPSAAMSRATIGAMTHSPPVGWADVATKQDLHLEIQALRHELHADMERMTRRVIMWTSSLMVGLAALAFAAGRFI